MGCCLLHGMGPLHGQGLERGGWTGMALEQQWSDRWSGSLGVETRWGNDLRAHRSSFVDAALEYALNKRYALNFQFRSSLAGPVSGALEPVNRAALRLSGNWKWGPGRVEARAMWQYAQRGPWHPEWGWPAEARATQRLRLGYELSRRGPVKLGANVEYMARSAVWNPSALRIRMDSDWKISERWRWGLGYQWEQDLGRTFPERSHTLRMSWTYSLPDRMEHVKTPPIPSPTIAPQPEAALRDSSAFAAAVFLAGGVLGGVEVPGDLPVCLARQVFISEVQTDSPDYVEWHNPSPQPCSLSGWRFDDDLALQDWLGNARAWIPAGGCLLLYAGGLGGFQSGLSAKGDVLFWASPDGGSGQLNLDPVLPGESWHFDVTGAGTRAAPTPGVR
jgi:hypothetical protein